VKLGITLGHHGETARDVAQLAAEVEAAGLDLVGMSDSQSIFRDTYCTMTAAALSTSSILIGPTTTNVTTRHPVVTAAAMATVDEAAHGRAYLTIGTGASSTANLGQKKATPKELREGVRAIRDAYDTSLAIAAGAEPGHTVTLSFATRKVDTIVSCSTRGPLAQRVAAEEGDGALLIGDLDLATVAATIAQIRAWRDASPRAGEPFRIWLYGPGWVSDNLREGQDAVGGVVSAIASGILRADDPRHGIPDELRDNYREFCERYSFARHGDPGSDHVELMRELGVADHLFGRLALVGTAAEVQERLRGYASLGIEAVVLTGSVPDKRVLIERLATVARRPGRT